MADEVLRRAIFQIRQGVAKLEPENMLRHVPLGDRGAEAIAAELEGNSTLTELGLCEHCLRTPHVAPIANALRANTALARLDLVGNFVGARAAAAFADALRDNRTLSVLSPTALRSRGRSGPTRH
eukprot:TRINITY_DN243_c0_g1_i2.p2 TRINITY_DN243_c0_g1~~TRINITY_DN243_c0_g1_i2.p2  ORF type:complete len:125 (+),score=9.42 TRINITY_DN243_c0_g1_i2:117-491(+)